jgi:hypothetical protein
LTGRGGVAIPAILEHLKTWPRDAMVLAPITGVFGLIGFSGKAGRQVEQLAVLEPFASAYGDDWWFRMVLAFAEIELHEYDRGLRNTEASLRGLGRNAHVGTARQAEARHHRHVSPCRSDLGLVACSRMGGNVYPWARSRFWALPAWADFSCSCRSYAPATLCFRRACSEA